MKKHYYKDDIIDICDKKHLTVEEIFSKINKKFPESGKSSIYRNVEQLVESGELRKVIWIWKKAYFEKNNWDHIHLIDKNTWEIFDFDENIEIKNLPNNFNIKNRDIKIFWAFS
jgi:Fe2+ or Zn2+ uptake regulation protein